MRELKFRAWDGRVMLYTWDGWSCDADILDEVWKIATEDYKYHVMQYTGLKDKNGVTEVYEGDIINESGVIVGNIYEVDKRETDFIIQGLGTKTWCETYRRAILLGCKDAE